MIRFAEIKNGDVLIADNGFTCLPPGEHIVYIDQKFAPYVKCDSGKHYLDGQVNDNGYLIGFSKKD